MKISNHGQRPEGEAGKGTVLFLVASSATLERWLPHTQNPPLRAFDKIKMQPRFILQARNFLFHENSSVTRLKDFMA